jgi:hypothetical protein
VVLDAAAGTWKAVPRDPGGDIDGRTVVAAGVPMLIFGGAKGKALRADTWIWNPA